MSTIYFVQIARDEGPIKIGVARNVKQRFAALQCASPERLKLLGSFPGSDVDERHLHRKFSRHRIRGEWFYPAEEIIAYLKNPAPPLRLGGNETASLIEQLGGTTEVAKRLGVQATSVSNWKKRGVPWKYRAPLAMLAKSKKVSVPDWFLDPRQGEQP